MPGGYICAGDTVAVKGDGATALTIDGVSITPTTSQMVILTCPDGKARLSSTSNTLSPWITAGYVPSGVVDGTVSDKFIYNETISWNGVAYPVLVGSTSDPGGHGDKLLVLTRLRSSFLAVPLSTVRPLDLLSCPSTRSWEGRGLGTLRP